MAGRISKRFTKNPLNFTDSSFAFSGGAQYPQEYFSGNSAADNGYYATGDPALTSSNFTHRSEYGTDRFGVNLDKTNFNGGGKKRRKTRSRRKRRKTRSRRKRRKTRSRRKGGKSKRKRRKRRKLSSKKIKSMRQFRAWKHRTYQ